MTRLWFVLIVAVMMGEASVAEAGWLWGSGKKTDAAVPPASLPSNAVKRLHLKIKDKEAEKELLQLVAAKRIVSSEKTVLLLLVDEKKGNLTSIDGEMGKAFGLRRDRNYLYDAKARTISEEPDKTTGAKAKVVMTMKSDSEAKQFASLAAIKQTVQEDLVVLARVVQEKEAALSRMDESMKVKFSMSRDMNYWYDPKEMSLYEVLAPSSKGEVQ